MDAFSSRDLTNWEKHERIIDTSSVKWAEKAMWAPSVIERNGKYFLLFGANDIQSDEQYGGIGVAVADKPEGPYRDYLGKPLIDKFYNGAQPIDQFVFKDRDGQFYMIYGGWKHCNIARLRSDFRGFEHRDHRPWPDRQSADSGRHQYRCHTKFLGPVERFVIVCRGLQRGCGRTESESR